MARVPDINLTPVQFEIMEAAWSSQQGATVAEIWETISRNRDVGRTTILNLVDRLEKRGWLARKKVAGVYRYQPTVEREAAAAHVAAEFIDAFFSGSASNLVMSLLGSKSISQDEIEELRAMLEKRRSGTKKSKGTGK
jgi:predicted transcriptional regulator